jgi:hypothetical protein
LFATSRITINGSQLGNALSDLLLAPEIIPGDQPSYELCKTIWLYHPLGNKMVQSPIEMAQSQQREISIPDGPEERVRERFLAQWEQDGIDDVILNVMATARAYGLASVALMCAEVPPERAVDVWKLPDLSVSFSVFDPLNTAGSLVLNQDPNSIDFQKVTTIAVSGRGYHRSRTVTMMNERPVYINYTASAFGFVGRSVFQRSLFPLKSFVQSMVTDDLVTKKAGVFIAMLKVAGAIVDRIMQVSAGLKRLFVQQATNGNVISIGVDEKIETLNMQNIDGAYGMARKNILENIAVSADMPAKLLNSETFAEGFGEGTEDAKHVARYIDRVRRQMGTLYVFFDRIEQHRAWTPDFYKSIQEDFPEYRSVPYKDAFFRWQNSFKAVWPNLLTEPDSEKVKTDDVKLKAIIATVEVFGPLLDPENKVTLLMWAADNVNENKLMFTSPLVLDAKALEEYEPPQPMMGLEAQGAPEEPAAPKPFHDEATNGRRMRRLDDAELRELVETMAREPENLPARKDGYAGRLPAALRQIVDSAGEHGVTSGDGVTSGPKRDRAAYMRDYRARRANGQQLEA